ncbi:MAG: hypothetical protein JKX91_04205 [Rhizobiaceae bacterium]|nr:hypothetical protein [Rhizobiaceae bacterium]
MNDTPIVIPEDDQYGIAPFAASLAKSILNIKSPVGTTIALHGPWGSGKSSAVNLIRRELEASGDKSLVVSEFKGWWYRGEEALALAFLQNLNSVLSQSLKDKIGDLIPKLGRNLLQAGPIIGAAVTMTPVGFLGAFTGKTFDFAKRFFPEGDPLEITYKKLSKILSEQDKRYLIIIDDIDRLNPDKALAVFRMVKSVGNLPNVMYLLVFDRALVDKTVDELYPSEGPHFLEKIIQVAFELPNPLQADLNSAVLKSIDKICGSPNEDGIQRIMNIFYDVVAPYLTTPRHVNRFRNAINVTWPAVENEVNLADFVALETLRLYEPALFKAIKANKEKVCGIRQEDDPNQNDGARFSRFLSGVGEDRQDIAKQALQRLFPRMETIIYGDHRISGWDAERRICVETHFDTYFRLSLSDEALPAARIEEICTRADDKDFIQSVMREAAATFRKTGKTMIPVYFDALNSHASRIDKDKIVPFMTSLFGIHDEIDLEVDADGGFYGMANTSLRYHWLIRRLTDQRYSLEERTHLYDQVIESSSLGWLVDFTSSAKGDYVVRENRNPTREEDCLVSESAIPKLTELALTKIRRAAQDGSLLHHNDLFYILYRWRDFNDNNPDEVCAWTDSQVENDEALLIFARQLMGESWSYGMGGFGSLGDRVSKRTIVAQISKDIDILDPKKLRIGLDRILKEQKLEKESLDVVQKFVEAWDRKLAGNED